MTQREPPRRRQEAPASRAPSRPYYRPSYPPAEDWYDERYEDERYEEDWWAEEHEGRQRRSSRQRQAPMYDNYDPQPRYRERPPRREERSSYREPPRERPRSVHSSRTQQRVPENRKKKGNKVVFSLVYNLLFYLLTIGILLSSVLFALSSKSDASIMGYRFYTVLTNSMVPQEDSPSGGFYAGDLVLVQMVDSEAVKEGDIVTFSVGDGTRYLTHRVVERLDELNGEEGDYLITKGDANKSSDPPIEADRVLGKVITAIPKVGSLLEFVRENLVLCLLFILSTFGFILVLKAYLFSEEPAGSTASRRPAYDAPPRSY